MTCPCGLSASRTEIHLTYTPGPPDAQTRATSGPEGGNHEDRSCDRDLLPRGRQHHHDAQGHGRPAHRPGPHGPDHRAGPRPGELPRL
ncbi:hypothetical protein, partial [Nocardioides sp. GCM10030258]|uniref:hypothetical protein n=1 Tax=unclassified Nocardioides TaxID=2615069 RepID=UPI00361D5600